jgi:hypothetical protein
MTEADIERFFKFVEPELNTGCWLWSGSRSGLEGYGSIRIDGANVRAHRASWRIHNGPVPDGMCVCHRCDTPSCINPAHLFLGTNADNNWDKSRKGRCPDRKGTNNGRAKLNENDVGRIFSLRRMGKTQSEIAAAFNCHQGTVSDVLTGRRWRHI